jgi:hypothetical protein
LDEKKSKHAGLGLAKWFCDPTFWTVCWWVALVKGTAKPNNTCCGLAL